MAEQIKDEKGEVTRMSLLNCQVCFSGTWDEALEWVKINNPAGTENNWGKSQEENQKPVRCAANSERWHYMFVC
jgi:hypothetical protein